MKLYAPEQFWLLTDEAREEISNGCGPKSYMGWIVPDTVWGLSVSPCCDIHDYMYHIGENEDDRNVADRVFLNNMIRIVTHHTTNKVLLKLRLRRVRTYYYMVSKFGGPAFWNPKNLPTQVRDV